MPGATQLARGNEFLDTMIYLPAIPVPNVNTQVSANQTVTVQGVLPGDYFDWSVQGTGVSGLFITNCYCATPNVLTFTWFNGTTGNLTGNAAQAIVLEVVRCDVVPYTTLPPALE